MEGIELLPYHLKEIEDFKEEILSKSYGRIQLKMKRISYSKEARDRRLPEDREVARLKAEFLYNLIYKKEGEDEVI